MRLQKVASVLLWCNLIPALWSAFVAIVGATDRSFSVKDIWSISAFVAYVLIVLTEVIFFTLFISARLQRSIKLWATALAIVSTLTIGACVIICSLGLWRTTEGCVFSVMLLCYAFFICYLTFTGLQRSRSAAQ